MSELRHREQAKMAQVKAKKGRIDPYPFFNEELTYF